MEPFIVYMAIFTLKMTINLVQKGQIALFIIEKVTIMMEYANFANVFLKKLF